MPLAALVLLAPALPAQSVKLRVQPERPWVEAGRSAQTLHLDLVVENGTGDRLELSAIEATVLDPQDRLVFQRRVDGNGDAVAVVPRRILEPGERLVIYNPLWEFPRDLRLERVRFDLSFDVGEEEAKHRATLEVRPQGPRAGADLVLPVTGRVLVHDGHDFYAHHRRLDWTGPMAKALGITENFTRYGYDFVVVDEQGRMHRGDGSRNEDWYGFGTPVLAPGAGTVVAAVGDQPDHRKGERPPYTREAVMANPSLPMGNHVVIDHGDGTFSLLAHLRQGSVRVKPGDRVHPGQPVGQMGFSGDAFLVHLHYDLKRGPGFQEGVPSRFRDFERFTGRGWTPVDRGAVDTGDVIRRRAR